MAAAKDLRCSDRGLAGMSCSIWALQMTMLRPQREHDILDGQHEELPLAIRQVAAMREGTTAAVGRSGSGSSNTQARGCSRFSHESD